MDGRERSAVVLEWVLRVASASIFFGHGMIAWSVFPPWIAFFGAVGLSAAVAQSWMPVIGALDIALAILVMVKPLRIALMWMSFWGLWTAILRPLSGGSFLELLERGGNWGAPLALLLLRGLPRSVKELFE